MYRTQTACLAAVMVCALGGCGTICNLTDPSRIKPFGGVIWDCEAFDWFMYQVNEAPKKPAANTVGLTLSDPIVTIDLPLSVVADTVTLPITVPIALMRQGQPESSQDSGPMKPTTPNGNENVSAGPAVISPCVPCTPLSGAARP
jgi:uncharacterized protein YceK